MFATISQDMQKTMQEDMSSSEGIKWTDQVSISEMNREALCIFFFFFLSLFI